MIQPEESIDPVGISAALGASARRYDLIIRKRSISTNSELLELAASGAQHGTVLVCEEQTAGRGRRGRSWQSIRGGSLAFSLLWRFAPGAPMPVGLSLAVGVAVAEALDGLGVSDVRLKWPNDVLIGGQKLAGILVELAPTSVAAPAAVIGIGVNVRLPADFQVPGEIGAIDLSRAMLQPPSRETLLAHLLRGLGWTLDEFALTGIAASRERWLQRAAYLGEPVRLLSDYAAPVAGTFAGVDDEGAALIETEGGMKRILSGELSMRAAP